jgi:hypothetical protein
MAVWHTSGGNLSNYAEHRYSYLLPNHTHSSPPPPAIHNCTKKSNLKIITNQLRTLIRQYILLFLINMLNDHCHWVSTQLQSMNIIIIIIIFPATYQSIM